MSEKNITMSEKNNHASGGLAELHGGPWGMDHHEFLTSPYDLF
jgi:hypothetical protein